MFAHGFGRKKFRSVIRLGVSLAVAMSTTMVAPSSVFADPPKARAAQVTDADKTLKLDVVKKGTGTLNMTGETVDVSEFRDPNTGELVRIQYQKTPDEVLLKFKSAQVRKMIAGIPPKQGLKGIAKEFILEFPAEYIAFTGALLLSSSIHASNDPASVKHFIDQNVLDPIAYVSFAGFLGGSRSAQATMRAMGIAYDPARAPMRSRILVPNLPGARTGGVNLLTDAQGNVLKDAHGYARMEPARGPSVPAPDRAYRVSTPVGPNRTQKLFAPLMGPIGLGAGMTVSNVIHELMADQDIRACSMARSSPEIPQEKADEVCDKAWENWVITKKVADYTPDILAMGSAALIQGYIVNKALGVAAGIATAKAANKAAEFMAEKGIEAYSTIDEYSAMRYDKAGKPIGYRAIGKLQVKATNKAAEKFVPYVFRGFRIVVAVGSMSPVGRYALTIGNIWMFMEIVHPITPLFKKPFENVRQGLNLNGQLAEIRRELDRAEKANWNWTPDTSFDWCMGNPMGDQPISPFNADMGTSCVQPEKPTPAMLLKKYAEKNLKWREFLLQGAYTAHQNWQEYTSGLVTMYASATAYYQQMIQNIMYHRHDPRNEFVPTPLYLEEPFYGITPDGENFDSVARVMALTHARTFIEKYLSEAQTKGRRLHSTERNVLPIILAGFKAVDPTVQVRELAPTAYATVDMKQLTDEQFFNLEARIRSRLVLDAIKKLREVLESDPAYTDKNAMFPSQIYEQMAQANPFMQIRLILGNPEPMRAGLGFLRDTNDDGDIIEQSTKTQHPDGIVRARTSTMSDYLLASMVCGPEADPRFSDGEKIKIYNEKMKSSKFADALKTLGLGGRPQDAKDPGVLIAVHEHVDEMTKSEKRIFPAWNGNSVVNEHVFFSANFRPPRIVNNVPADLCSWMPKNVNQDKAYFNIHDGKWTVGGQQYHGLLEIVKRNIRTDITGTRVPSENELADWVDPFNKWWTERIDTHVSKVVKDLQAQYRSIVVNEYIPGLLGLEKNSYEGFTGGTRRLFHQGLRTLNGYLNRYGKGVEYSALNSLYKEVDFYLYIIGRTTRVEAKPETAAAYKKLTEDILGSFKEFGTLASDVSYVEKKTVESSKAVEVRRAMLEIQMNALKQHIDNFETTGKPPETVVDINSQLIRNIRALMGELDSYWGVVRGIQVKRH